MGRPRKKVGGYIVIEVSTADRLQLEEIITAVQQPERAYDYASIKGAVIKENGEWKSFITKITLKRRKIGERAPFKILLQRPNFLIFHCAVSIKKLIKILRDLIEIRQFTIGNYIIKSDGQFQRRYFLDSFRSANEGLDWPADAYFYRIRGNKPTMPDDLRLKRDSYLDANHAIRELLGFKHFDHSYHSSETVLVFLPYYYVKISGFEISEKKLILKLQPYDETISPKKIRLTYIYGKEYRDEDRDEISPVKWHNEATLAYIPNFVHVLLFSKEFEDPVDEYYYFYRQKGRFWPEAVTGIEMALPDMFRELEAVLSDAGFRDAKAKIVLAAATNLVEVVIMKKLVDLGVSTTGTLNDKISRVVKEIEKKENRSITKELIPYVIKVTRDKADHAGFELFVRDEDAVFMLKRTIDFLRQLYA